MSEPDNSTMQVKGGLVPYVEVESTAKAIAFYEKAFGATVAHIYPRDDKGRTMHAHIHINGASMMMTDPYPEHGHGYSAPQGYHLMIPCDDVDAWFKRAVDAGAVAVMPPTDMFWGDRYAQLKDPFGILWALNAGKK